jgi:hypothetical protein
MTNPSAFNKNHLNSFKPAQSNAPSNIQIEPTNTKCIKLNSIVFEQENYEI